jgi:hypothetical protein
MKPYQEIKNAMQVVEDLKYELKYSKNKKKDINRINTLLRALKSYDSMLVSKYKINELNKLILALFNEYLIKLTAQSNNKAYFDINYIVNKIKIYLSDTSENSINRLADSVVSYEISRKVINGETDNMPNSEDIKKLINDLLVNLKTDMKWTSTK